MTMIMIQQCSPAAPSLHSRHSCRSQRQSHRMFAPSRHQSQMHRSGLRKRVIASGLFGLGLPEVAVVAGIAVLVFGPSKLPELGKELGKTVKSFQTAAKEFETELKNAADETSDKIEGQADDVKDNLRK